MSDLKSPFSENNMNPFDENLFRREDDLLNVFKSTIQNEQPDEDNKAPELELMEASSHSRNQFSLFNYCNPQEKY